MTQLSNNYKVSNLSLLHAAGFGVSAKDVFETMCNISNSLSFDEKVAFLDSQYSLFKDAYQLISDFSASAKSLFDGRELNFTRLYRWIQDNNYEDSIVFGFSGYCISFMPGGYLTKLCNIAYNNTSVEAWVDEIMPYALQEARTHEIYYFNNSHRVQ